jgi:NAD(P)-dependent dehydrogenase (short-subunit alcohol dehydrogenase family)
MLIDSVLITGANRGLGLEFIKQFLQLAKPPKHIFAVCRAPDKAPELKKLADSNPSVHVLGFEVTEPKQYDKAVSEVRKVVGTKGLNLLINNAGIFDQSLNSLESQTKENIMMHYEINVAAPVLLTKAFLPLLKDSASAGGGQLSSAVVNISAILGCTQYEGFFKGGYPYKYSKAALNMATHMLANELEPSGILVMAIHPGWVQTDMGGPHGQLTPQQSISGCLKVITGLNDSHRGKMFNWEGELIPYS